MLTSEVAMFNLHPDEAEAVRDGFHAFFEQAVKLEETIEKLQKSDELVKKFLSHLHRIGDETIAMQKTLAETRQEQSLFDNLQASHGHSPIISGFSSLTRMSNANAPHKETESDSEPTAPNARPKKPESSAHDALTPANATLNQRAHR